MPLFGELFLSEVLKKPVFDPKGEIVGRVHDALVVKGDPLPKIAAVILHQRKQLLILRWEQINLFSKRVISTYLNEGELPSYELQETDLLASRDILDKQIVDVNGVKIVRANDIKLEGYEGEAVLIAVDVGMRGILRRLGIERGSESLLKTFNSDIPYNLIAWTYMQPLSPQLNAIALTVSRQMVSDLHPADLAEIISQVPQKEGAALFENLDIETAADALSELEPDKQAEMIKSIEPEKAADIIEEMNPDDAADVLSDLPTEVAKEILEHIEKEDAEDIQELLHHEEDTAGGLMNNLFIAYPPNITAREALERFRKDAEEVEPVYYVFVVDQLEKLVGVLSLREMILADPDKLLADIMQTKLRTVTPETDEMVVAELISKYDLVAVPVVDSDGVCAGVITVDDIIDVIMPREGKRKRRKV
ncbi:MAG TPA: CBS domain-containing protein [Dissulfurispiraceae bacterium]|nr:CBS domain-containing protein [Dissulfurispiraceae bacterium]